MPRIGPVALAVVVVLAGCSGLSFLESERQVTVTPAEVPSGSETMPPGVTETGIVNVQALVDAHKRAVANESLEMTLQRRVVTTNGTVLYRINTTHRFSANRTYVYRRVTVRNSSGVRIRHETWKNDDVLYSVTDNRSAKTYNRNPRTDRPSYIYRMIVHELRRSENQSVEANGSDPVEYRLNGSLKTENGGIFGKNTTKSDGYFTAHISGIGFIERYSYGWLATQNNTTARDTTVVRFHRNATPPDRPAWVDDAKNATENTTKRANDGKENG